MGDSEKPTSTETIVASRIAPPSGNLQTGVWYSDFSRVKAEAERTGKPFFAMWINPRCGYCKRFCDNAISELFKAWMRNSNMLFWLGSQDDPEGRGGVGWDFVVRQTKDVAPHMFPLCAIWQSVDGKVIHDYRTSGKVLEQEKTGMQALENVLSAVSKALHEPPHELEASAPQAGRNAPAPSDSKESKAFRDIVNIVSPFIAPKTVAASSSLRIRISPDLDESKRIRFLQALADHGGFCPCRKEQSGATRCLCADFMAQNTPGKCRCGFYEKYSV